MSFGVESYYATKGGWGDCDRIVVSVFNKSGECFIIEELTAEEFFTEKYGVKIDYTYNYFELNGITHQVVDEWIFTYSYTETYQIPRDFCMDKNGWFGIQILAYSQGEVVGDGCQDVYYRKSNGQIRFMTVKEYYEDAEGAKVSRVTGTLGWYDDSDNWHPLQFVKLVILDVTKLDISPVIYTDEHGCFKYYYSVPWARMVNLVVYAGGDSAYAQTLTTPTVSGDTVNFIWNVPKDSDMWKALKIS